MRNSKIVAGIILGILCLSLQTGTALGKTVQEIYDEALRYTVFIRKDRKVPNQDLIQPVAATSDSLPSGATDTGTGIVIKANNAYYILTQNHVIEEGDDEAIYYAWFDEGSEPVKIKKLGWYARVDIAILEFADKDFVPPGFANLGDSSKLEVGLDETFYALGNPMALRNHWTSGKLSKTNIGYHRYSIRFLAFDLDCTFGFSGGPIIDKNGAVVGLIDFILTAPGTQCYATPSEIYLALLPRLLQGSEIKLGILGAAVMNSYEFTPQELKKLRLNPEANPGIYIAGILLKSPANHANMHRGDQIISFGSTAHPDQFKPKSAHEFVEMLNLNFFAGDTVSFNLLRGHEPITATAKLSGVSPQEKYIFIPMPQK